MNDTRQLATELSDLKHQDFLDQRLLDTGKRILIDGIANMAAGANEPLAAAYFRYLTETGTGPCTVVGSGNEAARPLDAVFLNGVLCHSMDYEIVHEGYHPTGTTLPVILAIANLRSVSGRRAIEALVIAFEVMGRVAHSVQSSGPEWIRIHPPGMFGPFGAAAAASYLLDLSVEQTTHAFGIAGSRVSGLMANAGSMTKASHSGQAARNGLDAALLARSGVSANPDIFGAVRGFNETYYDGRMNLELLWRNFGSPFLVIDPGISIKRYPSQYPSHWAIDAALEIRSHDEFDPADVAQIVVEVGPDNFCAERNPSNGFDGKFSVKYPVAAALLDAEVTLDTFTDEMFFRPEIQALMDRFSLRVNSSIDWSNNAANRTTIEVTTQSGNVVQASCDRPLGIYDNPLPYEYLVSKFHDCLRRSPIASTASEILASIEGFDTIDDIHEFVLTLAP